MVTPSLSSPRQTSLRTLRRWGPLPVLLSAALLTGCMAKRDHYDVPSVPLPDHFTEDLGPSASGGETPPTVAPDSRQDLLGDADDDDSVTEDGMSSGQDNTAASSAATVAQPAAPVFTQSMDEILPHWWTLLGNDELNSLVDRALTHNPDMLMASMQVKQAEARFEQTHADEFPTITAPMDVTADAPLDGTGSTEPGTHEVSERAFSVGLEASYRVDLWGERRSAAEAARLRVWQALLTRDNSRKTLIADLVSTYIDYLSFNDRLRVAQRTEKVLSEMLAAVQERLQRGDATVLDLSQQRAAVRNVQATIPLMRLQASQAAHRLAQLAGSTPAQLTLSDSGLDSLHLPQVLPGMPSTLLLRRPDVRAAEANLLAADADVDAARARVLPTFDLSAQSGYASNYAVTWLQPESFFWSLASNLTATIFDHGKREQAVAQTKARHEELIEAYMSAVFGAVRETEDALARLHFGTKRQLLQQQAAEASREAVLHSRDSYRYGATDYLTLLDTERTLHSAQDQLYQVIQDRYQGAVDLFSSLGGGVDLGPRLPGEGTRPEDTVPPATAKSGGVVMTTVKGKTVPVPAPLPAASTHPDDKTAGRAPLPFAKPVPFAKAPQPQAKPGETATTKTASAAESMQAKPKVVGRWLATLPGIFTDQSLDPVWHTLQQQMGTDHLDGLSLMPVPLEKTQGSNDLGRNWYSLAIGPFVSEQAAKDFCSAMAQGGTRCRSVEEMD